MSTQYTTDKELGQRIALAIKKAGFENPLNVTNQKLKSKLSKAEKAFADIIKLQGYDLTDDSMADTPKRLAKLFITEMNTGIDYNNFPKCTMTNGNMIDQMVLVKDIDIRTVCEHHLQWITGKLRVAYIPNEENKLLGLSKIGRIADFFSGRLQVQERLTSQIFCAMKEIVGTESVAVKLECTHGCMTHRGANKKDSQTITTAIGGLFSTDRGTQQEFLGA